MVLGRVFLAVAMVAVGLDDFAVAVYNGGAVGESDRLSRLGRGGSFLMRLLSVATSWRSERTDKRARDVASCHVSSCSRGRGEGKREGLCARKSEH